MNGSLRRSKMISFRLSPEEYESFQNLCVTQGVRSLSDLARTAMQKLSSSNNRTDPLRDEVGGLRHEIRSLSMEVDRLSRVLAARQAREGDGTPE
jgi:hypothetical protein